MCRKTQILGIALIALGAGILLSCLFDGWFLRFVLGAGVIVAGLLIGNHCA